MLPNFQLGCRITHAGTRARTSFENGKREECTEPGGLLFERSSVRGLYNFVGREPVKCVRPARNHSAMNSVLMLAPVYTMACLRPQEFGAYDRVKDLNT